MQSYDADMRSPRLQLQHLRAFIAVAEEENFRRAGSRLNTSQSVISRTIQNLENELGTKLFDRDNRSVNISAAGRLLLPYARRVMDSVKEATNKARGAASGELGQLVIGYNDIAIRMMLPSIIEHFCHKFPHVDLKLLCRSTYEMCPENTQGSLNKRLIDIGFLVGPVFDPDLDSLFLGEDELVVILPKKHRLTKKKVVSINDLRNERLLLWMTEPWLIYTRRVNELCRKAGFLPKQSISIEDNEATFALVAANLGIALTARSVASLHLETIEIRSLRERTDPFAITAVWHKENNSPLVKNFLKSVRTVCKSTSTT